MTLETCESLISFFGPDMIIIDIDACHVQRLSLGCTEEGGTVPICEAPGLLIAQCSGFEATQTRI